MNSDGTKTALWMSNLNLGAVSFASGVTQLDNTNTNLPNDSSKFISFSAFMAWDRTTSGNAASYTDPKFTPLTGSDPDYGWNYGTLYNYAAASANTINAESGANNDNAQYSLCPSGWRLPTGGSSGEFQALYDANSITNDTAGATKLQQDFGFSLAGTFNNSTPTYQGYYGYYWSSTRSDGRYTYALNFNSANVSLAGGFSRYNGYSVRCIKQDIHTLTISTGTGVDSVTIDGTTYHNGDTVDFEEGTSHTINMTFASGYAFDSWSISGTGSSVASTSTQSTTLTMGTANSTLTANGKAKQYLQDWNGCSSMSVGKANAITLYDKRDEQAYTVTKYNMGNNTAKCWMSNLNLGAVSFASGVTQLDNTNTNLPNDSSKFISASTFMAWDRTTSGTATSYTDPKFTPVTASNASNGLAADTYGNKYGTLYNYAAASAGTYVYASGSGTGDAQYSLCPYGWRLPTGNTTGEFQALYNANSITNDATGSTKLQQDFGFSLTGNFGSSTPGSQGSTGTYWSSTGSNGLSMYRLYFTSSNVHPADFISRNSGYSVRCIKE